MRRLTCLIDCLASKQRPHLRGSPEKLLHSTSKEAVTMPTYYTALCMGSY